MVTVADVGVCMLDSVGTALTMSNLPSSLGQHRPHGYRDVLPLSSPYIFNGWSLLRPAVDLDRQRWGAVADINHIFLFHKRFGLLYAANGTGGSDSNEYLPAMPAHPTWRNGV